MKQQLKTADLIFEAMQRQEKLRVPLVVKTGGLCNFDGHPLVALSTRGVHLFKRQSIPTCLKCETAHHPLNGLGSRDFDGVDDNVNCGSAASLDDFTTRTITAWVNPDNYGEAGLGGILNKEKLAATIAGAWFGVYNTYTGYIFQYRWDNWAYWTIGNFAANVWVHAAVSYDKSATANDPVIYLDAVSQSVTERTAPSGTAVSDAAEDLIIGNSETGGHTFDGKIAHVTYHNVILTANEIAQLRTGRLITRGLAGYWPLWGLASSEADLSGNLNNGAVTGAVLANHPPVGRYAPYRFRALPLMSNVEYINVSDSGIGTDAIVGITEWLLITDTGFGTDIACLQGEILVDDLSLPHVQRIHITEPTIKSTKPVSIGLPKRKYLGKEGRSIDVEGWTESVEALSILQALADGAAHVIWLPDGTTLSAHITSVIPRRSTTPNEYPYMIHMVERMD